ncbi:DUF6994 family protein [Nesterenkonia sp. PF2B19]|uniref:DUF6994 family protein n=1 Tax=Nesterenkonia sp. PF2B19 TaxID=1881858 RepID=UPI00111C4CEF
MEAYRDTIDVNVDVRSGTRPGKDPDSHSPAPRRSHRTLWSKPLPHGDPSRSRPAAALRTGTTTRTAGHSSRPASGSLKVFGGAPQDQPSTSPPSRMRPTRACLTIM